jgi:predicted metal-dependent enzyme (double-stranded beta helix superfamily)
VNLPELTELVKKLADTPALWTPLVRHDPDQRTYEQLLLDEHLEVWLISWMSGHDTGFHDHGGSSGAGMVVTGKLREERLRIGGPPSSAELRAGDTFAFDATDIHRVLHPGGDPAVSIHAYSPPLNHTGSYVIEPSGALRRHALGRDVELRTLAPTSL